jgi:hypothetical protein
MVEIGKNTRMRHAAVDVTSKLASTGLNIRAVLYLKINTFGSSLDTLSAIVAGNTGFSALPVIPYFYRSDVPQHENAVFQ